MASAYSGTTPLACAHQHVASCRAHVPNALLRRSSWLSSYRHKTAWSIGQSQQAKLCHSTAQRRTAPGVVVAALRGLYPPSKAHQRGMLPVSPLHTLVFEVHGNPKGQPVLCVHGGPGGGAYANHARFFDLRHWRVVLVDQRSCGASTPRGCLTDNTTQALIADFEALREHLGIERWVLFGGSWGTALSLAYAQAHTDRVDGLILRAICLMTSAEIDWMYRGGVAALQPKAWADFLAPLPEVEQEDPLAAYHRRLTSPDAAVRKVAVAAWLQFDMAAGKVPSQQLQSWNGTAWLQGQPGAGAAHRLPPLKRTASSGRASNSSGGNGANGANGSSRGPAAEPASSTAAPAAGGGAASPPWQPQLGFGAGPSSAATAEAGSNGTAGGQAPAQQQGSTPGSSGGSSSGDADSSGSANSSGAASAQAALPPSGGDMSHFEAQARLEAHYCVHHAFLLDQPILENVDRLRGIPAIAIQGCIDLVCPPVTAFRLHKTWPELQLRLVGGAGHSQYDPAIQHELLEATDAMRDMAWVRPSPRLHVAVY